MTALSCALIGLLFACSDSSAQGAKPPQKGPGPTNPSTEHKDMFNEINQLVTRLAALPELNKAAVENVLHVQLAHSPEAPPAFLYSEAPLSTGPFAHVELREPNASQHHVWLLVLSVRPGVLVPQAKFKDAQIIGTQTPMDINPDVPPEGIATFALESKAVPGQTIKYTFRARSLTLESIVLDRDKH
ncbi:MAG TPA: hypothetical protein VHZ95_09865 [Polyangiales bacterium]|nr:hypothetical protein [Polyangiales bacterium]